MVTSPAPEFSALPSAQPAAAPAAVQPVPVPSPAPIPPVPAVVGQGAPAIAGGAATGVNVPGIGNVVPMTRDQLRALDRRTSELSNQWESARDRRADLVEELAQTTSPVVISGLEARIGVLDARLVSLEQDIASNGALKSSIGAKLGSVTADAPSAPGRSSNDGGTSPLALIAVFFAAVCFTRLIWWGTRKPPATKASPAIDARFAEMEQAIDTVAVEIERVAEGQRFVSKLLREGQPVPDFAPARVGDPVNVRDQRDGAR